jgi:hypothetical protein
MTEMGRKADGKGKRAEGAYLIALRASTALTWVAAHPSAACGAYAARIQHCGNTAKAGNATALHLTDDRGHVLRKLPNFHGPCSAGRVKVGGIAEPGTLPLARSQRGSGAFRDHAPFLLGQGGVDVQRDSRLSLATSTAQRRRFAAVSAAASCGRRSSASLPFPVSTSVNVSTTTKRSGPQKRCTVPAGHPVLARIALVFRRTRGSRRRRPASRRSFGRFWGM